MQRIIRAAFGLCALAWLSATTMSAPCQHYERLLKALDKMDPAFAADNITDVKALMRQLNCS